MKLFSITLILVALFGLLAYTNPGLDSYDQFISQRITEETKKRQRSGSRSAWFFAERFCRQSNDQTDGAKGLRFFQYLRYSLWR